MRVKPKVQGFRGGREGKKIGNWWNKGGGAGEMGTVPEMKDRLTKWR